MYFIMMYKHLLKEYVNVLHGGYMHQRKVPKLDSLSKKWLSIIEHSHVESERTSNRAKCIRLRDQGFSHKHLSQILSVREDTITSWFKEWEKSKFDGLKINLIAANRVNFYLKNRLNCYSLFWKNLANSREQCITYLKKSIKMFAQKR